MRIKIVIIKSAKLENILKECDVRVMRIHNFDTKHSIENHNFLVIALRNETFHTLCNDNKPRLTQLYSGLIRFSADYDTISDNANYERYKYRRKRLYS